MQKSLPVIIIDQGNIQQGNVELTGKDKGYFLDVLRGQGCDDVKKVLIMTVDGDGKVYLQQKGESYRVFHLHWDKKAW